MNMDFMGRVSANGNEEVWGLGKKTMGPVNGGVESCPIQSL
jgi:hypothetical protein